MLATDPAPSATAASGRAPQAPDTCLGVTASVPVVSLLRTPCGGCLVRRKGAYRLLWKRPASVRFLPSFGSWYASNCCRISAIGSFSTRQRAMSRGRDSSSSLLVSDILSLSANFLSDSSSDALSFFHSVLIFYPTQACVYLFPTS